MFRRLSRCLAGAAFLAGLTTDLSHAAPPVADITPHRAIYSMTLERAQSSSGVTGASGQMLFEWSDGCDGWTIEQRYKLRMQYAEADETELAISFVTWEAKDGSRYRFNVRKLRDGETDEDLRGEGRITGADGSGVAEFVRPERRTITLGAGALFPSIHTGVLIEAAQRGEALVNRVVFDGGTTDGAFDVSAAIGKTQANGGLTAAPDLATRWWPVRMAFFPAGQTGDAPDYEMGIDLQENGIVRAMTLDYGSFVIRAKLEKLEALQRPKC